MKVTYYELQKKYPLKIVALDKAETRVVAVGNKFNELLKTLSQKKIFPKNCVFVGPIQKQGAVNVYLSVRKKTH